jgi:hypothetical protein
MRGEGRAARTVTHAPRWRALGPGAKQDKSGSLRRRSLFRLPGGDLPSFTLVWDACTGKCLKKRTGEGGMPRLTGIALGQHIDGSLELVAASAAHENGPTMWHAWQRGPNGDWTGWHPLGKPGHGAPGRPSIMGGLGHDNRLEVFVVTSGDRAVWHRWQTGPELDRWSDWESLGKPGGHPAEGPVALGQLADGRIMAVVTAGGRVWRANSPGQEPQAHWPAWSKLGRPDGATAMAVAARDNAVLRVELAALGQTAGSSLSPIGMEGNLWHRAQTGPEPDDWSDWEPLGEPGGYRARIPVFGQDGAGPCTCSRQPPVERYGTKSSTATSTGRGHGGLLDSLLSNSRKWPSCSTPRGGCSWSPRSSRAIVCGMRRRTSTT